MSGSMSKTVGGSGRVPQIAKDLEPQTLLSVEIKTPNCRKIANLMHSNLYKSQTPHQLNLFVSLTAARCIF